MLFINITIIICCIGFNKTLKSGEDWWGQTVNVTISSLHAGTMEASSTQFIKLS